MTSLQRELLLTMLMIPGHVSSIAQQVTNSSAQAFILDLEDTVPTADKDLALNNVTTYIKTTRDTRPIYVRVNKMESERFDSDTRSVLNAGKVGINLPKVETASCLRHAGELIDKLETANGYPPNSISIIATVETARGALSLAEICSSSARLRCICIGVGDLSGDLGVDPLEIPLSPTIQRVQMDAVLASAAAGLEPPHDSTHPIESDHIGLMHRAIDTKALGFMGKHVRFEAHVDTISRIYSRISSK